MQHCSFNNNKFAVPLTYRKIRVPLCRVKRNKDSAVGTYRYSREIFINTHKFLESYTEHSRPIYIPSPVTLSVIYSNFDVADVLFYKLGEVVEQIYM